MERKSKAQGLKKEQVENPETTEKLKTKQRKTEKNYGMLAQLPGGVLSPQTPGKAGEGLLSRGKPQTAALAPGKAHGYCKLQI